MVEGPVKMSVTVMVEEGGAIVNSKCYYTVRYGKSTRYRCPQLPRCWEATSLSPWAEKGLS